MFIEVTDSVTTKKVLLNANFVQVFEPQSMGTRAIFDVEDYIRIHYVESLDEIHEKIKAAQAESVHCRIGSLEK